MIGFGLRITLRSGREAAIRLALTAAAVAMGVGLLLVTLAGINGLNTQNDRFAWLTTGSSPAAPSSGPNQKALLWLLRGDEFDGQVIGRIDVAAAGPRPLVPPGIGHLPGPGQYYASPALTRLLRSVPAAQLRDRFPGHQIGTISSVALPAPNSLIIVAGHAAAQLASQPGVQKVTSIQTTPPSGCDGADCAVGVGDDANAIDLILSVVALALLFPVLIFIGAATRLSAARREQRFAAMRLVGATPRQVGVIAAVESTTAAVIGVAAGFGVFFLLRPGLAAIPFTGVPFFTSDLSLSLADVLLAVIGIPAAAAIVARLALRRVVISPLGVSRRVTPAAPRAWRMIPLLAGAAELGFFVAAGRPATTQGQIAAYLPGFFLVMTGLVIAGPWLTLAGSRFLARRASRPAALIAGRRLADNPQAGFRAISGLILALFITSVAAGVITTIDVNRGPASRGAATTDSLIDQFDSPGQGPQQETAVAAVPGQVLAALRAINGVRGVTVIHASGGITVPATRARRPAAFGPVPAGLASCSQLAGTPALGRCPAGAAAVALPVQALPSPVALDTVVWPASPVSARRLQQLPAVSVVVGTDGSTAAIEQARTELEDAYPYHGEASTVGEMFTNNTDLAGLQQLANVVIIVSLPIAGCTLAVSVAAGLTDRKRAFSLLRLTGVPVAMLRRVVALESAVPLLVIAVVSTGAGLTAAALFVSSQLHYSLSLPGPGYFLLVLAGLAASLATIGSTLPLLSRITGPETARIE